MEKCRTCGKPLEGNYCSDCGEKVINEKDYSIKKVFSQSVDIFTHFDGKFFISLKFLLFYPGKLTTEYLNGRRIKLMKPLQLYIVIAVVFFFLFKNWDVFFTRTQYLVLQKPKTEKPVYYKDSELTGSNLQLKRIILNKAAHHEISFEKMIMKIDSRTPDLSKALLFLIIPILGLILYVIGIRKYSYYTQHLFHAMHIFTFLMALSIIWIGSYELFIVMTKFPINYSVAFVPVVILFVVYIFFSVKRVYQFNWLKAMAGTILFSFGFLVTVYLYNQFITYFSVITS